MSLDLIAGWEETETPPGMPATQGNRVNWL
jgi:hypothetical protein